MRRFYQWLDENSHDVIFSSNNHRVGTTILTKWGPAEIRVVYPNGDLECRWANDTCCYRLKMTDVLNE